MEFGVSDTVVAMLIGRPGEANGIKKLNALVCHGRRQILTEDSLTLYPFSELGHLLAFFWRQILQPTRWHEAITISLLILN